MPEQVVTLKLNVQCTSIDNMVFKDEGLTYMVWDNQSTVQFQPPVSLELKDTEFLQFLVNKDFQKIINLIYF